MTDLSNIQLALFDYDDTLCIHQTHTERFKGSGESASLLTLKGVDEWKNCLVPKFMVKFLNILSNKDIKMGLISCTNTYIMSEAKVDWVYREYGIKMLNYCVGRQDLKIPMAKDLREFYNIEPNQILFVDDMFEHLVNASKEGFVACSPTEIACYIENYT